MAPGITQASGGTLKQNTAFAALALLAKFSFEITSEQRCLSLAQGAVLFKGVSEVILRLAMQSGFP